MPKSSSFTVPQESPDVAWLEVAMNHESAVRMLHGSAYRTEKFEPRGDRKVVTIAVTSMGSPLISSITK